MCLAHHTNDLCEQRLCAHALGGHDERAGTVHCPASHLGLSGLFDGDRFARHHRLVDCRRAFKHAAVYGDPLARPHPKPVANMNKLDRDIFFTIIGMQFPRGLRRKSEQVSNRRARACAGAELENLSEQDQHDNHRSWLEVDRYLIAHPKRFGKDAG